MEKSIKNYGVKEYALWQKILLIFAGALLTGAMWRARGSHGWGSEWGVFTVGTVLTVFIYAVFSRRQNASFFHIAASGAVCILTVPAWGTLLNQTSGYFEAHATEATASCTPLSGVFIMLCLGFGMLPLLGFMISRLFSDKKYSIFKYALVIAVFFTVHYICCATVSHFILKLVQPESVAAFTEGLKEAGKDGTAYSFYMKHFASIGSAKKIPYGRNYFTEISVISRAIASFVTAVFIRFALKDKVGGRVTFFVSTAFSVGVTAANIFFVLKNKFGYENHPWLKDAWGFWEYFTGFIAGGLIIAMLFVVNKKHPDTGVSDVLIPKLPSIAEDIIQCAVVMGVGCGFSLLRPFARRLDASDILPIIVYSVGGAAVAVLCVLMFTGKLPKLWKCNASVLAAKISPMLFGLHMIYYMFVGYTEECLPYILMPSAVQVVMYISVPLFFVLYFAAKKGCVIPVYKTISSVKSL